MSRALADRLSAVQPSVTLAMNAKAAELRATGVDVVAFGVGEPDFEPPSFILDAAKKAIDTGVSKYTAVTGIAPLKEAICARARARGIEATPAQVTVTVGAKHALFNLALALFEPGDEVIIPGPYWVSYPEQVKMMGAEPICVDTTPEEGFKLTPEKLAAALSSKTKALILCTPSNPTGAAYSEPELRALLEVFAKADAWLIVDEIYAELVYDGFVQVAAAALDPKLADRIIVVDGVSKTYAMTGWRIGWSITPSAVAKAINVVQGQSTTNPTAVAQYAALAALTGPQDEIRSMRDAFQARRNVMLDALRSLPGVTCRTPEGAFYAFPDMRALYGVRWGDRVVENDEDLAFFLLENAHVAVVPGSAFGAPGYLRMSYATTEAQIRAGVERIRDAVAKAR